MRKLAATLAACLLALTACSSDVTATDPEENPKSALEEALRSLVEADTSTVALTLSSTPESLMALAADSGSQLSEEDANKFLTSSIVVSGANAEEPEDANLQFLLNIAGSNVLEMRVVQNNLYLRVDADQLVETFGGDPASLDQFVAQAGQQPGFEFVEPAVNGEWLVIENLQELTQQMGATPLPDQEKFEADLQRIITDNASVTSEGDDDQGTHLVATLPLQETAQDLEALLSGTTGMLPSAADMPQFEDVPEGDIALDIWVADGEITQIEFDFLQLAKFDTEGEPIPEGVEQLALRVDVQDYIGDAEPVDDAFVLDPNAIGQALGGMMGQAIPAEEIPFDCSQLEGSPPEVLELYAEECPELQP